MVDLKGSYGPDSNNKKAKEEKITEEPYWRSHDKAYEAIHTIDGDSKVLTPAFLCFDGKTFSTESEIDNGESKKYTYTVKPISEIPYEPYHFNNEEIQQLNENVEYYRKTSFFPKVLATISPYQDTLLWHRQVDSAGICLSYRQNQVESVPYIYKVGAAESGKTRGLEIVRMAAYRPLMAVDMTAANVYRYYGKTLQGVGTIIHDEADDGAVDQDKALRAIYNAGYKFGARVPRIGGENKERQDFWNCFGIKWFGGIELPWNRAFRTRIIVQNYMQGVPEKIDILPEDRQMFLQLRKELLVQRLVTAFERFEPVNTGLKGRSRELYTPMLAVLENTPWYNVILQPLIDLDNSRREEDRESKQGYLARAIIGCWLNAAAKALGVEQITGIDDLQLTELKTPIFVSNASVIANLGMQEATNEKGRKILVSDDVPFTFTNYDVGRIQSENLGGGKPVIDKDDNRKSIRGHRYEMATIRRLHHRYASTVSTLSTDNGGFKGGK